MGIRHFGTLALMALAVTACGGNNSGGGDVSEGPPEPTQSAAAMLKGIYALPDCDSQPGDPNTMGTVNIVLPNSLSGGKIIRTVYQGPKVAKNDPSTGKGDPGWGNNNPWKGGSPSTPPFDAFVNTKNMDAGYLLVRVLILQGSQFGFYTQDTFQGVGSNDANNAIMCSASIVPITNPGSGEAQSAATFYIDLSKLHALSDGASVPFTIGVVVGGKGSTPVPVPIMIDPRIINEGGGMG